MTTTPTDHSELRRKAEAATPGNWSSWQPDATHAVVRSKRMEGTTRLTTFLAVCQSAGVDNGDNAAYIAAANPSVVIALLDQLEAYREALEPFAKAGELFVDYQSEWPASIYNPAAGAGYAIDSDDLLRARKALSPNPSPDRAEK